VLFWILILLAALYADIAWGWVRRGKVHHVLTVTAICFAVGACWIKFGLIAAFPVASVLVVLWAGKLLLQSHMHGNGHMHNH